MSAFQKVIKYFAIGLAALIIVSIITAIISAGSFLTGYFFGRDNTTIIDSKTIEESINKLDIELKYANLEIKEGKELKVDVTSKDIEVTTKDNILSIKDKNIKRFINTKRELIVIYLPQGTIFDEIDIDNGVGKLNIEKIITNKADLDLGVGKSTIEYIKADDIMIDTGTGSLEINDCELNNANISVGIGALSIKGIFTGDSTIDSGIGSTNINLLDSKDNYKLVFSKGIGSIKFNSDNVRNDTTTGDGNNTIKIDGGIGSINVTTK